jgi:hypothetical protein
MVHNRYKAAPAPTNGLRTAIPRYTGFSLFLRMVSNQETKPRRKSEPVNTLVLVTWWLSGLYNFLWTRQGTNWREIAVFFVVGGIAVCATIGVVATMAERWAEKLTSLGSRHGSKSSRFFRASQFFVFAIEIAVTLWAAQVVIQRL